MTRKLYDLAGEDRSLRFSPFCWRAKLALAHKGLSFESVDVAFTAKDTIAFSGQKLVPVLVDDEHVVCDSWAIALYLDETYGAAPTLMDGAQSRAHAFVIKSWVENNLHLPLIRVVLLDLVDKLAPVDQTYFRETREARFGTTLEAFALGDAGLPDLYKAMQPVRTAVGAQPFLGGEAPSFADHLVVAALLWGRSTSNKVLVAADDEPLQGWLGRIAGRYGEAFRV